MSLRRVLRKTVAVSVGRGFAQADVVRGAFATPGASPDAHGSGAPSLAPVRGLAARRGLFGLVCLCLLGLAALLGSAPAAIAAEACPASTESSPGFRTYLLDCRAYELVSQLNKNGQSVMYGFNGLPVNNPKQSNVYFASSDGRHVMFGLTGGPEAMGGQSGETYVAGRTAGGWESTELSPPLGVAHPNVLGSMGPAIFSDVVGGDFSRPIFQVQGAAESDPSKSSYDIYEGGPGGSLTLLSQGSLAPNGTDTSPAQYAGGSSDGSHILFRSPAILESQATGLSPGAEELYDRSAGQTHVVGLLPGNSLEVEGVVLGDGSGVVGGEGAGSTWGTQFWSGDHAISRNGSRIFFENLSSPVEVYMRENDASTTTISLSQRAGSVGTPAPQGARFQWASADGSKVLFDSHSQLTDDATAGGGLYGYDVETHTLSFLTPDSTDLNGAEVQSDSVIAASEDGSRIYFVAQGKLEGPGLAGKGTSGQPNLYLYESSPTPMLRFIATFAPADEWKTSAGGGVPQVRATPDGRYLAFVSSVQLTGYNNNGHAEIYRYDAEATSEPLVCVSCDPNGPPVADASLNRLKFGAPTNLRVPPSDFSPIRNISADGSTVFFETKEPLVPQAVNGKVNVYEWHDGQLGLISSGSSPEDSHLYDVSASGQDVFFTTYDQLVPSDGALNVYDARVDGGFPAVPPPALRCSSEDECRGALSTPAAFGAPSSTTFAGVGNLTPLTRAQKLARARAQKLARALKACKRKPKKKRASCVRSARHAFAAKSQATKSSRRGM